MNRDVRRVLQPTGQCVARCVLASRRERILQVDDHAMRARGERLVEPIDAIGGDEQVGMSPHAPQDRCDPRETPLLYREEALARAARRLGPARSSIKAWSGLEDASRL
jgi:hypothetical protein